MNKLELALLEALITLSRLMDGVVCDPCDVRWERDFLLTGDDRFDE